MAKFHELALHLKINSEDDKQNVACIMRRYYDNIVRALLLGNIFKHHFFMS